MPCPCGSALGQAVGDQFLEHAAHRDGRQRHRLGDGRGAGGALPVRARRRELVGPAPVTAARSPARRSRRPSSRSRDRRRACRGRRAAVRASARCGRCLRRRRPPRCPCSGGRGRRRRAAAPTSMMASSMRSISSSADRRALRACRPANNRATASASSLRICLVPAPTCCIARRELAAADRREARQQEAIAHRADHAVVASRSRRWRRTAARPCPARRACGRHRCRRAGSRRRRRFRAARPAPRPCVSVCIDRIEPKSFSTMMPKSPICRSRPPCAPLCVLLLRRARQQPGHRQRLRPAPPSEAAPSR